MHPLYTSILFFVAFVVASAKAGDETREFTITEDDLKNLKKCADDAGYEEGDLKELKQYLQGNADTKFKCFLLCLYKADDIINNGKIDEENLLSSYHGENSEKLKNKMAECAKSTTGSDDCELAYNLTKCMAEA